MVEAQHVHYRAGGVHILDDVSVQFRPRQFNVILGANGAGKSTLLRIVAGLAQASSGAVIYDGENLQRLDSAMLARRRAVLSQRVDLAFPLDVSDVVMMGRYPHYGRVPRQHDVEIVDAALALVDMVDRKAQPYPTLSGGEQQKVQLARVLAQIWRDDTETGERYLFLDEPTANLDVHYQLHVLNAARALLPGGCTVIAILHDLNVAFEYGDAFFLLDRGHLIATVDGAENVSAEMIDRAFRVKSERTGDGYWKFSL